MRRAGGGESGAILEDPQRIFLLGKGRQRERRGMRESGTGRGRDANGMRWERRGKRGEDERGEHNSGNGARNGRGGRGREGRR